MPIRFICSIHAPGYSLACSTSRTVGLTSRSTNARTVSTSIVSSSFSAELMPRLPPHLYGHIDTSAAKLPASDQKSCTAKLEASDDVRRPLLRRAAGGAGLRRRALDDVDGRGGRQPPGDPGGSA